MLRELKVTGRASSKSWSYTIEDSDLDKSLLDYLSACGLPIASSCSGVGKCKKCAFNGCLLSCVEKVSDWLGKEIYFDYL
ncbi:MAG: hypothetical protein KC478_17455 [Bacteriovoracaceae bacterium]|nr:hypothetical protein [Bacteriovoracaceae bacterium]